MILLFYDTAFYNRNSSHKKTGHECIQALLLRLFVLTTNGAFFDTVASL